MRSVKLLPLMAAGLTAVVLSGCAKTNLTNLWRNPEGASLQSILVVSLEKDPDLRHMWEDAITAEFQANGVSARPGYALFPSSLPDSQQVLTVTKRDGYDGVVVTHRLSTTQTGRFDSDYSKAAPGESDNYWRSWYHTHYTQALTQAPIGDEEGRYQIDVANAAGRGTLVWTGSTTPIKATDEEKLQAEVCGQLVSELTRQGLVAKRK
jgi:hypothetical protein